jgi:hypothetical protein
MRTHSAARRLYWSAKAMKTGPDVRPHKQRGRGFLPENKSTPS